MNLKIGVVSLSGSDVSGKTGVVLKTSKGEYLMSDGTNTTTILSAAMMYTGEDARGKAIAFAEERGHIITN